MLALGATMSLRPSLSVSNLPSVIAPPEATSKLLTIAFLIPSITLECSSPYLMMEPMALMVPAFISVQKLAAASARSPTLLTLSAVATVKSSPNLRMASPPCISGPTIILAFLPNTSERLAATFCLSPSSCAASEIFASCSAGERANRSSYDSPRFSSAF